MPDVSVIICTHNPHERRLARTLAALRAQTLPLAQWELLLVDNAGTDPRALDRHGLSWHPGARILREPELGLTPARLCGIRHAQSELLVLVDDDNELDPDYLAVARAMAAAEPRLGAFAGRAYPDWEVTPPAWTQPFHAYLALRDLGDEILRGGGGQFGPEFTPNGAGMVVRSAVARRYLDVTTRNAARRGLDRSGQSLASHGDLDLAWTSFDLGLEVAYVPQLSLRHIIPAQRLTRQYLGRLMHGMAQSGVFFQAARSGQPPAPPPRLLLLRKLRQYLLQGALLSPAGYARWRYYCGRVEGQHAWHARNNGADPR